MGSHRAGCSRGDIVSVDTGSTYKGCVAMQLGAYAVGEISDRLISSCNEAKLLKR